ncbi:hypothetical protein [Devosia naphthalenivorans]|uniref:hypothetical protein n=1 Tax=Devosia naphthalenivorans TaxID=2082392 RepID=UPI000D33993E|nr:hypothetical protein [Devosia naphthalenivorans]
MTHFTLIENNGKPVTPSTVMTMSRRHFNSYLYYLYDCQKRGVSNDADADMVIADAAYVEVLLSPDGPLVAVHHGERADLVTVFRAAIDPADLGVEAA